MTNKKFLPHDSSLVPALGRRRFMGLMSGALVAGSGLSLSSAWGAGKGKGVLQVGGNFNPSSLDPATGGSGDDHVYLFTMYDTLVDWDAQTLQAVPGLAQTWEFPDEKTLVLTLREDVKFHDGTPLDAEAVKINLDRSRSAEFSNIRADLASIESIQTDGDHVVVIALKRPDTALPLILSDRAGMMVSPKALAEHNNRVDRSPVGTGFMKFEKWDDGSQIVVSAYPEYHDPSVQLLDGIVLKIIPDTATRLRSTISGQTDLAYQLSGRQLLLIERSPKLTKISGPTLYCYQIYLNMAKEPLHDVRVRQALNYAVNRTDFVRAALGGAGEPAYMNLPKDHWAYDEEVAKLYEPNPDKARELLAEAGYPDGITLNFAGYTDQSSIQMQEVLLEQFERAGIRGRFRNGTIAEMSAAYFAKGEHDLLLSAWTGRPDPSLSYSLMYTKDGYFNAGHVAPPDGFDKALAGSLSRSDLDERRQALAEVQRLVMEHALVVPLAFREDIIAQSDKVQGVTPNLLGKPKFKGVSLA